jgi:hypothetical protein
VNLDRPYHHLMAAAPTLHARMEIAKAIRLLAAEEADDLRLIFSLLSNIRCV